MADLTLQRGAIPIELDRPRTLFFDMQATGLLIARYGRRFITQLYSTSGSLESNDFELHLVSAEALAFFLFAGLQADARQHGETLTLEQAESFIHPWDYEETFRRVVYAVVGNHATPAMLGKAPADSAAAEPPAAKAARKTPAHPGPTKVSTSTKRSASRSRSSAGRRRSSGR